MSTVRYAHRILALFCVAFTIVFQSDVLFAEEPVTLELWSHWGGEAVKMRFVEETIQSFEAANPRFRIG